MSLARPRSGRRASAVAVAALSAAALLLPGRGAAQSAGPAAAGGTAPRAGGAEAALAPRSAADDKGGLEVELAGSAIVLAPLARLADQPDGTFAELSTSVGLGGSLGAFLPGGVGGFAWAAWVPGEIGITRLDPVSGFPTTETLDGVDWLAVAAGLAYAPQLRGAAAGVRPFISAGVGVRRLALGDPEPPVEDATDFIGTVAAGVGVEVSPALAIRFEVRDAISDYDSPAAGSIIQNDLTISIGLAGRLR